MRSFWSFWWQCSKRAAEKSWGHFNFLLGLVAIISAVCVFKFVADWLKQKGVDMNWWLLIVPVASLGVLFLWNLAKVPFEIYKQDMQQVTAENQKLASEFQSFHDKMTQLKIEAIKIENRSGVPCYECHIKIRNLNKTVQAQGVEAKLTQLEGVPTKGEIPHFPLPNTNTSPIHLRPIDGDGKAINPGSEIRFILFRMIRASNMPTIEFFGRDSAFSPFVPHHRWECDAPKFRECLFRIEVSARECPPIAERFWLDFSAGMKPEDIATFYVEKLAKD